MCQYTYKCYKPISNENETFGDVCVTERETTTNDSGFQVQIKMFVARRRSSNFSFSFYAMFAGVHIVFLVISFAQCEVASSIRALLCLGRQLRENGDGEDCVVGGA